jgi:3-hydroxyacyl-[acyl-carrier-protein] dehydratase
MLLPYAYPFLFIDKAVLVAPKKIVCIKNVTGNEYYFAGHFKDNPVMPGVVLVEAMAQSTYLLARLSFLRRGPVKHKKNIGYYLACIKDLRFLKPVYPGEQITIEIKIKTKIKNTELVEAKAYSAGELVCKGELIFASK